VAAVAGFGGMRVTRGRLAFDPRLPSELTRVAFGVRYQGSRLRVEITHDDVVYRLAGSRITFGHCGETLTLEPGAQVRRGMPDRPPTVPVEQPRGRAPRRRSAVRAS
jgi:alpha,alpha-trehalose phosphorylase